LSTSTAIQIREWSVGTIALFGEARALKGWLSRWLRAGKGVEGLALSLAAGRQGR